MRIHVVIASVNRSELLVRAIDRLADQSRKPDGIHVAATSPADVAGLEAARIDAQVLLVDQGLCKQRNHALLHLDGKADVVVFFDDDFVPTAATLRKSNGS